jgi:hypothetical protein
VGAAGVVEHLVELAPSLWVHVEYHHVDSLQRTARGPASTDYAAADKTDNLDFWRSH